MTEDEEKLAIWLVKLSAKLLNSETTCADAVKRLKATAKAFEERSKEQGVLIQVEAKEAPKKALESSESVAEKIRAVFGFWVHRTGRKDSQLTSDRTAKIRARLAEGYSVEDMQRAIDGMLGNEWFRARNITELTKALQTGSQLEEFRGQVHVNWTAPTAGPDEPQAPSERALNIQRLRKEASEARKRGDKDGVERCLREIEALG